MTKNLFIWVRIKEAIYFISFRSIDGLIGRMTIHTVTKLKRLTISAQHIHSRYPNILLKADE